MGFFISINVFLAVFNMLPVLPLDGGRIFRDILTSQIGLFKAYKYSRRVSKGLGLFIVFLGIIQVYDNIYNFSLIFLGSYIFYFLKYEESEVYFMNMKNLVYKRSRFLKKGVYPGRELVVIKTMRLGDIVKDMDFDRFHIIYVLDEDMKLAKVFTEQEIIDNMAKYDSEISFDELMKSLA
jgi:stage IV sporulation protein FB